MMDVIARTGSFAAAARELGKVPSALTYNVRQLEDALDVLLFDRRSGQAQMLTAAGEELLQEGRRLLASRWTRWPTACKRVACGWETQLTIAVNDLMSRPTVFELCEHFFALRTGGPSRSGAEAARASRKAASRSPSSCLSANHRQPTSGPGTRLRLRTEVLAGTWEALLTGNADLAIGVGANTRPFVTGRRREVELLGDDGLCVRGGAAPPAGHATTSPIPRPRVRMRHRAVAVADSAQRHERRSPSTCCPGRMCSPWPTDAIQARGAPARAGMRLPGRSRSRASTSAAGRLVVRTAANAFSRPFSSATRGCSPMAATPAAA